RLGRKEESSRRTKAWVQEERREARKRHPPRDWPPDWTLDPVPWPADYGLTRLTSLKRPSLMVMTTAGLMALWSGPMVMLPVTAGKSLVWARASRMAAPSVDLAFSMAANMILAAS